MLDLEEEELTPTTGESSAIADTLVPVATAQRRFGRYELGYEIASGGMATIYLGRARGPGGFDRPFAIKRIHPHLAKQRDFIDMFLDEARLQSRISHPNVCSVVDFGEVDGTYYMAMEYLPGRALNAVAKAVAARPELARSLRWQTLAARIIGDACEGLHAAHELRDEDGRPLSVVHRDVTPHNLFLTYDGAVKVIDFGVALAEGRTHETRTGAVKGKFAYMSPEQVRGREIDRRVDVWALGVCLWELLTGQRLYGRRPDVELIHAIVNEPLPPPSSVRPVLPALEAIVMRALERDIERRTPTARALGRELSTFVAASGVPAGTVELAELMQELDGVEMSKKLDVLALMMSSPDGAHAEPTQSGARPLTATLDLPLGGAKHASPSAPAAAATLSLPGAPPNTPPAGGTATISLPGGAVPGTAPPASAPAFATLPPTERTTAEPAITVQLTRRQLVAGVIATVAVLATAIALVVARVASPPDVTATELRPGAGGSAVPPPLAAIAPVAAPPPAVAPSAPFVAAPATPEIGAPVTDPSGAIDAPAAVRAPARDIAPRGSGTLNVATTGGWAEIVVDGTPRGTTPRRLTLAAGRHLIELRRPGHPVVRRTVTVRRGDTTRLAVALE